MDEAKNDDYTLYMTTSINQDYHLPSPKETSTMNDTSTGRLSRAMRAVFESQKGSEDNTGIHEEPERPIEQNDEDLIFHDYPFLNFRQLFKELLELPVHHIFCPLLIKIQGNGLIYIINGSPWDDLRQRSGVISFKQKVKTLEHWQRKCGDFDYWSLIEMSEVFIGQGIDQDVLGDNPSNLKVLQAIARMIPNDKWMRFVRLELGLNRKEIKELHRQYATFTEDQLIDIMEHLSIYGRLPEEAPTSAINDGYQKPLPSRGHPLKTKTKFRA